MVSACRRIAPKEFRILKELYHNTLEYNRFGLVLQTKLVNGIPQSYGSEEEKRKDTGVTGQTIMRPYSPLVHYAVDIQEKEKKDLSFLFHSKVKPENLEEARTRFRSLHSQGLVEPRLLEMRKGKPKTPPTTFNESYRREQYRITFDGINCVESRAGEKKRGRSPKI